MDTWTLIGLNSVTALLHTAVLSRWWFVCACICSEMSDERNTFSLKTNTFDWIPPSFQKTYMLAWRLTYCLFVHIQPLGPIPTLLPPVMYPCMKTCLASHILSPRLLTVLMFKASTESRQAQSSADLIPCWETKRHWVGRDTTHTHTHTLWHENEILKN